MAEKKEKKVKPKKGRAKGPKLVVGDFPYVSLMPLSRKTSIEVAEAKTKWVKTVGAGVVIAIVIAIASFGFKVVNQLGYDGAQREADAVEVSILEYEDVDSALTIKKGIEGNIVAGTLNAINWSDLHDRIAANLPEGSSITSFDVATGGGENDRNAVTVYLNMSSLQPMAYAQISEAFNQVPGILADDLIIGNLTGGSDGTVYTYPIAFTMDSTVLSKRWDYLTNPEAAAPAQGTSEAPAEAEEPAVEEPVLEENGDE